MPILLSTPCSICSCFQEAPDTDCTCHMSRNDNEKKYHQQQK